MHHHEFLPPPQLRDAIKCFWHNRREARAQQPGFEVQPDGYAEIIFYFGELSKVHENGALQLLSSPLMMGLLNRPVNFHTESPLDIIGIRCYPWAVFDLLGLPSGKNEVQTFRHPIAGLQDILGAYIKTGDIEGAMAELGQYFSSAHQNIAAGSMLFKAGQAMRRANGTLLVSEVAAAAHATVRTLERNFKTSSGHTVKNVSALMRFEQVRNRLWHSPEVNLAGLAHELGYTDQSHLSREFKRFSGATPAAFAREAKKERRILPGYFVAFVQS